MTNPLHSDPPNDAPLSPEQERLLDAALGFVRAQSDEEAALKTLVETVRRVEEGAVSAPKPTSIQAVLAAVDRRVDAQLAAQRMSTWQLFRNGLRHSALLRVAAASLLVHLAALPVLAWLHYSTAARPALNIYFERNLPLPIAEEQAEILAPLVIPQDELGIPQDELERPASDALNDNELDQATPK
jgi:hypothetical protein